MVCNKAATQANHYWKCTTDGTLLKVTCITITKWWFYFQDWQGNSMQSVSQYTSVLNVQIILNEWCSQLNVAEGCLQLPSGFSVSIYRTTSRNEHSLSGEMFLEVTSSYVILHQLEKETRQVMQWPLVHIRKFKCEDRQRPAQDLLTLEASW